MDGAGVSPASTTRKQPQHATVRSYFPLPVLSRTIPNATHHGEINIHDWFHIGLSDPA